MFALKPLQRFYPVDTSRFTPIIVRFLKYLAKTTKYFTLVKHALYNRRFLSWFDYTIGYKKSTEEVNNLEVAYVSAEHLYSLPVVWKKVNGRTRLYKIYSLVLRFTIARWSKECPIEDLRPY